MISNKDISQAMQIKLGNELLSIQSLTHNIEELQIVVSGSHRHKQKLH